jgi:uncharacterized membrane protein YraQ (UPF0718 family)
VPTPPTAALAVALVLSGVGLFGGFVLLTLGRGRTTAGSLVEGLTLGLVPTMVLLRLLPHVAEGLGAWALVLIAAAFAALRAFDRAHHRVAARVGRAFIYTALLFHSFTDGVGLAAALAISGTRGAVDFTLTSAFVVHRLPEGLFIATTLLPSYGRKRTLLRILGLFIATVAGGMLGGALIPHLPERAFDAVVALGLGAMLQLVVHSHAPPPADAKNRALSALALICGVVVALAVPSPRDLLRMARPSELPMIDSLLPLFIETAPYLLGAMTLDALLGFLPVPTLDPSTGRGRSILRGALLGVRLPLGPGGILPAMRGLWAQGERAGAVIAFGLAAATLGFDTLAISTPLLGPVWTLARIAAALLLLIVVAFAVDATARAPSRTMRGSASAPATPPRRRTEAWSRPLRFVDQRGAWYLAGLLCAASLEAGLPTQAFAAVPPVLATLAVLAIAAPLFLPLVALTPVVAVLVHKGLPAGSALLILLLGPALDVRRARYTASAAGRAALLVLVAVSVVGAVAITDALAGALPSTPAVHPLLAHAHGAIEIAAALLMGALLLLSLARLGPRLWLRQLRTGGDVPAEHAGPDEHDETHEHA